MDKSDFSNNDLSQEICKLKEENENLQNILKTISNDLKLSELLFKEKEEKYKRDCNFLHSILNSPSDIIVFALDRNYCYSEFTKYHKEIMLSIWGKEIEIGDNILEIISNEPDRIKAKVNFDRVLNGENFVVIEEYGDLHFNRNYYENHYSSIRNHNNQIIGISVFVIDISLRIKAEETNRINNELFNQIMKHTPIYFYIKKVTENSSIVLQASENFNDMIGIPGSKMVGKNMYELFPEEFASKITNDDWDVIKNGKVLKIDEDLNGRYYTTIKFPIIIGDGTYLAGYTIDITERKQAENNLYSSQKKYHELIELAVDGVLVGSHDGYIIDANTCICNMFGRKKEELIGLHISDSIFTNDSMKKNPLQFEKLHSGEVVISERDILRPDGEIITIEMRTKMMPDNTYQSIYRDITDRKRVELEILNKNQELANINASKDKFFSIIAHDLKSPLSSFMGLSQIMAEDIHSFTLQELQYNSNKMKDLSSNVYKLLENLLEWSLMQRGVTSFNPDIFYVNYIIKQNISVISEFSNQKEITILDNTTKNLKIFADAQMVNSVFRNLISNSIKFTNRGGIIQIGDLKNESDSENQMITFYVKDNGIGISKDIINRLFKLEEKVSRLGTEKESSTGLGLILCKEFINRHGGEIWVESEEDKGSTFYFTLPSLKK